MKPHIPKLPDKLREDLKAIIPSEDGDLTYWPCAAHMKDGTVLVCVYVVPEGLHLKHWGIYPQQVRGKSHIYNCRCGCSCRKSEAFACAVCEQVVQERQIWNGYTISTVVFAHGSRQAYGGADAVDFIRYPEGKGPSDAVDVLPHEGRNAKPIGRPEYYWCLFSE